MRKWPPSSARTAPRPSCRAPWSSWPNPPPPRWRRKAPAGSPRLAHFIALQPLWTKGDALRIETLHQDDTRYDFNVTRCRYAEMYKEMGIAELGAVLSCNRDGAFCEGYDPKLKLERTQTIMGGATHCDFRYRMEE